MTNLSEKFYSIGIQLFLDYQITDFLIQVTYDQ